MATNFRDYAAGLVKGLSYLSAYWGSRFIGTLGLYGDSIGEGGRQAFYARLPGHPEQAPDSLLQTARDRDFWRFIGEGLPALAARTQGAWEAYEQGGTPQQVLRVLDQWGEARFAGTWVSGVTTITESGPSEFIFYVEIPIGLAPVNVPRYGDPGLFYGLDPSLIYGYDSDQVVIDIYRLVSKWKPARSLGHVSVGSDLSFFVY